MIALLPKSRRCKVDRKWSGRLERFCGRKSVDIDGAYPGRYGGRDGVMLAKNDVGS
jgi:hypothetical protein